MTRGFIDGEYQDGELRGCTFIAGKRGMGKTTEMGRLLSLCSGGVLFFDALSRHDSALPTYKLFVQPGDLRNYLRVNRSRRFRVLYQPRAGSVDEHFRAVCTIVRAFGSMIFGVDELDMLCGGQWGDSRMPPEFYHLVNYGRHCRVSMLATARRPMSVARGFTSQCLQMRLFGMTERADLKYFEDYIGEGDARRLAALQKYQYLHWTGDGPAALCGGKRG
jgi:hypothetical protein